MTPTGEGDQAGETQLGTADPFAEFVSRTMADRREELVDLCRRLVEAPSDNPPGDTREVARVVQEFLRSAGVDSEVAVKDPRMPNLVASVRGSRPGPHLVLNAHMDTILPGDQSQWSVPAHSLTRRDGRLYGLGMGNMKGAVAAMCFATALLASRPEAWGGTVTLTAVSDEVVFGDNGASFLLQQRPELLGDAVLSGEGPGWMRMAVAEKGVLWVELEATVRAHQAAVVEQGSTAIVELAAALVEIDGFNALRVDMPPELQGVSDDRGGHGLRVTANTGIVRAGSVINQVATPATAQIDFRLPPGLTLSRLEDDLAKVVGRYAHLRWRRLGGWESNWTSIEHPLSVAVAEAARTVRGQRPAATVRLPASDASKWRRAGKAAVCYGPQPTLAAGVDDYAEEEDVLDCAIVYAVAAALFSRLAEPAAPGDGTMPHSQWSEA